MSQSVFLAIFFSVKTIYYSFRVLSTQISRKVHKPPFNFSFFLFENTSTNISNFFCKQKKQNKWTRRESLTEVYVYFSVSWKKNHPIPPIIVFFFAEGIEKIFRQITYSVNSFVKSLLSRTFCQKVVRKIPYFNSTLCVNNYQCCQLLFSKFRPNSEKIS